MSELVREVEKNDVDISELFKWNKEVEILDINTGDRAKVHIRLLGDADIGKARTYGYRKSGELRNKLKTPETDERISLLAEINDFASTDIIIDAIEIFRISDIYQEALRRVTLKEPKEPQEDDLEKWENYQKEVDSYGNRFRKALDKEAEKLRLSEHEQLVKRSREELYSIYESEIITKLCQEEMNKAFYDMAIYLATFKDEKFKTRAFKDFESFQNVHPSLKAKLKEEYQKLEVGIEVIKK